MPNITIDGPRIEDLDIKRNLIHEITIAVEKAYKIAKEHIIIVIKENSPENVGVGGILISDRRRT